MKILLVHYALPPQSIIGPSVHVYQLAQGLAKHGHAVDVLTLNNNELNGTLTDEYPINNFEVLSIVKNQFHSIFSYILNSASIIKKLESNYDIIHAHTISSSSLLIYKPRTPSVVTVHGVYSEWYNKMKSEIISEKINLIKKIRLLAGALIYSNLEARYCRSAENLIVLTEKEKRLVKKHYSVSSETNFFMVPNGVEIKQFECLPSVTDRRFFLFVGRMAANKGILDLLHAWEQFQKQYPNINLVIAGRTDELTPLVYEYSQKPGLNIIVEENCSIKKLYSYYKNAVGVIIPSRFEGLPLTLLDAMGHSKAILLSDKLDLETIIGDSVFFFNPSDPDTFASAIETVLTDDIMRADLEQKSRLKFIESFSLDVMIKNVCAVYETIIEDANFNK
jgi:glycosyltransferase involved in cell wall biosynthesis